MGEQWYLQGGACVRARRGRVFRACAVARPESPVGGSEGAGEKWRQIRERSGPDRDGLWMQHGTMGSELEQEA